MQTGLGGIPLHHFPSRLRKVRAVSILCLTPGGGVAPPNTPFPAARPEGGGAQILGAGRASVASPSRPHGRLPAAPQPRVAAPTCSPGSSSRLGARAGGRVSQLAGVSATRPAPAGTKCSGPGPGSSRRPARLGPAVCKHKVSQGAGERVS